MQVVRGERVWVRNQGGKMEPGLSANEKKTKEIDNLSFDCSSC